MKQLSFACGFELSTKKTRKRVFLEEMNSVVPWGELVDLISPYQPIKATGRPAFSIETMLRIHFLQQWFNLSDPAMEEALHDTPIFKQFANLDAGASCLPDESTILRFRHMLQSNGLGVKILETVNRLLGQKNLLLHRGTVVDATLIAAPSSTKNKQAARDPEMHSSKKGKQYYFGMKCHIGVDADSGLVHTVRSSTGNVSDISQAKELLHGKESLAIGDSGYQGVEKRPEHKGSSTTWHTAMRKSKRKKMATHPILGSLIEDYEKTKAKIRAKVEHPFRIIKQQFGFTKVRYRGISKNDNKLHTMFALANLWMIRKRLLSELVA